MNWALSPTTSLARSRVVAEMLQHVPEMRSDQMMVVGAWCRDIWHHALGHRFRTAATQDLDLAVAVDSWAVFEAIANTFPRAGNSGIRFLVADVKGRRLAVR